MERPTLRKIRVAAARMSGFAGRTHKGLSPPKKFDPHKTKIGALVSAVAPPEFHTPLPGQAVH